MIPYAVATLYIINLASILLMHVLLAPAAIGWQARLSDAHCVVLLLAGVVEVHACIFKTPTHQYTLPVSLAFALAYDNS
jgi:hypothetical protein